MDEDIPFAGPGPVYVRELGTYNSCFKYSTEFQKFLLPYPTLRHLSDYTTSLGDFRKSIGRLAFCSPEGTVDSFWTGFFVSPKLFVTTAHSMKTAAEVQDAGGSCHKITRMALADVTTLDTLQEQWWQASLLRADLTLDLAIYKLNEDQIPLEDVMPMNVFTGTIALGANVAAIVYNGTLHERELQQFVTALPETEKPPFTLNRYSAAIYLQADYQSLSPGRIVAVNENNFGVSCSLSPGSSGSPVFLLTGTTATLVGFVTASKLLHNYNVFRPLTTGIIEFINPQ